MTCKCCCKRRTSPSKKRGKEEWLANHRNVAQHNQVVPVLFLIFCSCDSVYKSWGPQVTHTATHAATHAATHTATRTATHATTRTASFHGLQTLSQEPKVKKNSRDERKVQKKSWRRKLIGESVLTNSPVVKKSDWVITFKKSDHFFWRICIAIWGCYDL
jgi:hypothetical protein